MTSNPWSKIGLGTATFGREINAAESFALMDHALAKGVNHFDTAAAYTKGESEKIIGEWLRSRRPKPGTVLVPTKAWVPYSAQAIRESVEQSLKRLQVDSLDLFYFHKWDDTILDPGVLAEVQKLVEEGKIQGLGASNFDAIQLERILQLQKEAGYARFQALQNNNNYAVRHIDENLRRLCAAEKIAIITFSPLGAGFLTGKHRQGVKPGSRFDLVKNNPKIYFNAENERRLDQLHAVAHQFHLSPAVLAMAWALHQPGVASVLVGGRTAEQFDQGFAGLAVTDPEIFRQLE
jgi:1-deoxyxylulose-5-phosphate synthase